MRSNRILGALRRTFIERRPLIMSIAVLGWSTKYLVELGLTHTTGPELYGVLTAALAVGAALLNLTLIATPRGQTVMRDQAWVIVPLLVLWAVIAVAGVAGTAAHVIGPVAGHGPVDLRPRPIAAPLVFTGLGLVGGVALSLGRRVAARRTAAA